MATETFERTLVDCSCVKYRSCDLANVITFKRKHSPEERFATLIQPHFDALYKAARRMTMSSHDAEDLVQEVCIKAFERLDELEGIDYAYAWLLRVMYNRFIDNQRRGSRSPVDIAPTGVESSEPDILQSSSAKPEDLVDREQNVERVLRAMRCLDADDCALIGMRDVEGFSINDLSELTGMPAGTIKSRLHRTRAKLGRLLSNDAVTQPRLKVVGGKHEQ